MNHRVSCRDDAWGAYDPSKCAIHNQELVSTDGLRRVIML